MSKILDIEGKEYNGVWKLWKVVSLSLFAAFVAISYDISKTLKNYSKQNEKRYYRQPNERRSNKWS